MQPREIYDYIQEKLGDGALGDFNEAAIGDSSFYVAKQKLVEVGELLRDDPELDFCHLSLVTGLDFEDRFESVYHLVSYEKKHDLTIRVKLPKEEGEPEVPSLVPVWKAADWHERETFDLMGIKYAGHPNLRRILLPQDWEGHPLRKDYVAPDEYHGVSNLP